MAFQDSVHVNYYFGIAAEDKAYESLDLNVYVVSELPMMQTNQTYEARTFQHSIQQQDPYGNKIQQETSTKNYITATYLRTETNRAMPPDIRRGEHVMLLRVEDSDTYYWIPINLEPGLRRCERYWIQVSDSKEYYKGLTKENTYGIDIDTLQNKQIHIYTALSDGEKYRYDILLDPLHAVLSIQDSNGQSITFDTEKKNIHIISENEQTQEAPSQIKIDTPQTVITGDVMIAGNVTIGGNLEVSGTITCGGLSCKGSIRASGSVTGSNIN